MKIHLILWAIVLIITVILELATTQLVSIWFAAAAIICFVCELLGMPFEGQLAIFLLSSVILLVLSRPLLKKFSRKGYTPTNSDADIGKLVTIIEDVIPSQSKGRASLNGVDWIAVSSDGCEIPSGSTAIIKSISGAKLIVEKVSEKQSA